MRQAKGIGLILKGARRPRLHFVAGLATALTVLVTVLAASALAASPETIAEYGTGAGRVSYPLGTAVDRSTGDLYVTERNNFRVSKFDPSVASPGNFLFALGYGVADGKTPELQTCGPDASPPTKFCFAPNFYPTGLFAQSVAVDQSSPGRDFYVGERYRVSKFTSSGQLIFMVGKNVNKTKEAEAGATQAEKDFCAASSGDTCGQGESGAGPNEFSGYSMPIAVDSAGVVWVGDYERIASFDSSGSPGAEIALPGAGDVKSLALDSSGDFYVRSESLSGVRKLEAGTGALLETLDALGEPRAVTLDEANNVYVGDATSPYRFKVYDPTGEQTSQFGAGEVIGAPGDGFLGTNAIAVDKSAGKLYAASTETDEDKSVVQAFSLPAPGPLPEKEHVARLEPTTVTLAGELNPEGHETTYQFEWGTSESYGQSTPTKTLPGSGFEEEPVEAGLIKLIPSTTYHFRLCAINSVGTVCGSDTSFTTQPAVAIDAQQALEVAAHSATLSAELDPLGVQAEAWVEYGASEGYGQVVPLASLGEGFGAVLRQTSLTGLQASTTYHYRFAARDERDGNVYTVHGADRTFTTQFGGLGFQLADNRAWEMVSPPNKHGALLFGGGENIIQAAADGNGLAYESFNSVEEDPEASRAPELSMILARRSAGGAWHSKDITSPSTRITEVGAGGGSEYKLFDANLDRALLEPHSGTPLSGEASERTPYIRDNTEPPSYMPLVTGKEGFANVPPGTEFGGQEFRPAVRLITTSRNLEYFGLSSKIGLVAGAPVSTFGSEVVYEWSRNQIKPVSVLPDGTIVSSNYIGSQKYQGGGGSTRGAISDDGTRVFWTAGDLSALYMRDTEAEETVRLDVVQGGSGSGAEHPVFQGASADGSVAFFSDSQQLTPDASREGSDLYRCTLPRPGVPSGCASLTDLSVPVNAGERDEVRGIAAALTEDGSTIYFVATGVLDRTPNRFGDSPVSGEPNLYVWRDGDGVRFIATLSHEDRTDWGTEPDASAAEDGLLSTAASPSGRYLAFMSSRSLTGYETGDPISDKPAQEVFLYDAATDRLDCISCNPTGQPPFAPSRGGPSEVDPTNAWEGQRVAAALPWATTIGLKAPSLYRPRTVLTAAACSSTRSMLWYRPTPTASGTSTSTSRRVSATVVPRRVGLRCLSPRAGVSP